MPRPSVISALEVQLTTPTHLGYSVHRLSFTFHQTHGLHRLESCRQVLLPTSLSRGQQQYTYCLNVPFVGYTYPMSCMATHALQTLLQDIAKALLPLSQVRAAQIFSLKQYSNRIPLRAYWHRSRCCPASHYHP